MDPELEEFLRACEKFIEYVSDQEDEDTVYILEFVRAEAGRPYGDSDDEAAAIAFSKLSPID